MVEVVALCPIDKIHFSLINTHVQPLQSSGIAFLCKDIKNNVQPQHESRLYHVRFQKREVESGR